ncbi:uncharacterized protein LOC134840684 [Symsagittifera roscoffensis]|uniref:uncharacterized protein LOC134840684 n=1 Tax=Symsagittifera roscoffensis TaxID=84072 RepID=UPI00307B6BAB
MTAFTAFHWFSEDRMIYVDEHMWTGMNQWGDAGQNAVDVNSTQFVAPGCTALWAAGEPNGAAETDILMWLGYGSVRGILDHSTKPDPPRIVCDKWTKLDCLEECSSSYFSLA